MSSYRFLFFSAIGSLSDTQATLHFKSSNVDKIDTVSIFSNIPRPIAVERLRDSADGPTPPVVIPCGMVASEVDGFIGGTLSSSDSGSTSTHIYCKPVKVNNFRFLFSLIKLKFL